MAVGILRMMGLPVNRRTPRRHSNFAANEGGADAGGEDVKGVDAHFGMLLSKDKCKCDNSIFGGRLSIGNCGDLMSSFCRIYPAGQISWIKDIIVK